MELRQLRYFVCLAEELHFRIAAEKLNITQPPLSQSIKLLENELGVRLFDRGRRKQVELTEAGKAFLRDSKKILQSCNIAKRNVHTVASGESGTLNIAHTDDYVSDLLPQLVGDFNRMYPDVMIRSILDASYSLAARLGYGEFDCIFTTEPLPASLAGYCKLQLSPTPIVLAMSSKHRLARKKSIRLRDAANEQHLYAPINTMLAFDVKLHELLVREEVFIHSTLEFHSALVALELVRNSKRVLFASLGSIPAGISGIKLLPINTERAELQRAIVWQENNRNPILYNFLSIVKANMK